ncbi:hypothetical protein JCM8547_003716 [Rhodosporidiobolus lusitaniae]
MVYSTLLLLLATGVLERTAATPAFSLETRGGGGTVELTRRGGTIKGEDGFARLDLLEQELTSAVGKYARNAAIIELNRNNGTLAKLSKRQLQALTYDGDALWSGPIYVGTPPQAYNVYFDTASTDFLLPSYTCTTTDCLPRKRYDYRTNVEGGSTTAVDTDINVSSYWATGSTGTGHLVRDTVTGAGRTALNQDILTLTSFPSAVASHRTDGVLGLAYRTLSAAYSYSFPFTLSRAGMNPWVGLRLSPTPGQSQIAFAGYNRGKYYGAVKWFNVGQSSDTQFKTFWQIGGSGLMLGRKLVTDRGLYILDTGSSLIIAPSDIATQFWAGVDGARQEDLTYWSYPCDSPPDVSISFARVTNKLFTIAPEDFNIGQLPTDPTRCLGAVTAAELGLDDGAVIVGEVFFKSWYVVLDTRKSLIGIATPRKR